MPIDTNRATSSLDFLATFELHRLGRAFLEQPAGRPHAILDRRLVAQKRHVGHHLRALGTAGYQPAVVDHLIERDGQGVGLALHHHAQAVAHQHDVDASAIRQAGKGHIVGGHCGDLLALALAFAQVVQVSFFTFAMAGPILAGLRPII